MAADRHPCALLLRDRIRREEQALEEDNQSRSALQVIRG